MSELFQQPHLPILLLIGLSMVFGTAGARLFQRMGIPQVVGYIAIGLLLGSTGFQVLSAIALDRLRPFNYFALGVIGFMIGGELHRDVFRKYGRPFFVILCAEGVAAFLAVWALCGLAFYWISGDARTAIAGGMLFGAIASATAPAATVDVLWELKARGPLTTTVFALVALDDALALALFAVASGLSGRILGRDTGSWTPALTHAGLEMLGAVGLGAAIGLALNYALRRLLDRDRALAFTVGALALTVGLAALANVDPILTSMALGATLTNLAPRRSHRAFQLVSGFATPIYVIFFVTVGARLNLRGVALWIWALALAYVLGRTAGKLAGAWAGARAVRATAAVRRYLGRCLFSQAGVAIGLSILAGERLAGLPAIRGAALPDIVMAVITATTFLAQIIGPPSVKWAVTRAGEAGLNVTEEDLARTLTAREAADSAVVFREEDTLVEVLNRIATSELFAFPVVNARGAMTGIITIEDFRTSFHAQPIARWLLACDLMQKAPDPAVANRPLAEAMGLMNDQGLDYLPVVDSAKDRRPVGMLHKRSLQRRLANELLRRRQLAEADMLEGDAGGGARDSEPRR